MSLRTPVVPPCWIYGETLLVRPWLFPLRLLGTVKLGGCSTDGWNIVSCQVFAGLLWISLWPLVTRSFFSGHPVFVSWSRGAQPKSSRVGVLTPVIQDSEPWGQTVDQSDLDVLRATMRSGRFLAGRSLGIAILELISLLKSILLHVFLRSIKKWGHFAFMTVC